MEHYIGYGFDVNDVPVKEWVKLFKKYDKDEYDNLKEKAKKETKSEEEQKEYIEESIIQKIEERWTLCEYLRDVINGNTDLAKEDIVESYNKYLVFASIDFIDNCPRALKIRNASDFILLIQKYIDTEELQFGNLWEGTNWHDPNYFMNR